MGSGGRDPHPQSTQQGGRAPHPPHHAAGREGCPPPYHAAGREGWLPPHHIAGREGCPSPYHAAEREDGTPPHLQLEGRAIHPRNMKRGRGGLAELGTERIEQGFYPLPPILCTQGHTHSHPLTASEFAAPVEGGWMQPRKRGCLL